MFTVPGGIRLSAAPRLRLDSLSSHLGLNELEFTSGGAVRDRPLQPVSPASERAAWFRAFSKLSARELGNNPEWLALGVEPDPSLFDAGVMQLALRWESQGNEAGAVELYASLENFSFSSEFAPRARARLDALRGIGGIGVRAEGALQRFSTEALDPAALAGFVAGGLAFRLGRAWALGRLATSGVSRNPLLLRSLASALGFGVEVPAFVLGARAAAAALGRPAAWDSAALGKDLASAALVLGPMKLLAAGGAGVAGRLAAPRSATAQVLVGVSTFSGVYLGHRLEQAAGLRPAQSGSATAFDSMVTLLQAQVAGGLANAAFGSRLKVWEQSLDRSWQDTGRPASPASGKGIAAGDGFFPRPALAAATDGGAPAPVGSGSEGPQKGAGLSLMTSRGGGAGLPKRVVGFGRGALAWGGDDALNWLLELRRHFENHPGKTQPGDFELWWIPESPIDTVLLNDFGVLYRRGPARFERINIPTRISLRALWPALRKGEAFIHTADLSSDLGRVLNKWTEREDAGLQDLINAQWLELQIENLCRKKLGFVERLEEKGRSYLLFEKGKRQLLPPNLAFYARSKDPRSLQTQSAPRRFLNQYWWHSPIEAAQVFGEKFGQEMPSEAMVSHFLDPRALMLPTWAAPLGPGFGGKFFFMQGYRSWIAGVESGQLRDVTARVPADRIAFLREIADPKPSAPVEESATLPVLDGSASAKVGAEGEPAGTKPYPSDAYPDKVFNAATVPYPEMFPKTVDPEKSVIMALPGHELRTPIPEQTTGPTEKLTGEAARTPRVRPSGEAAVPFALPLPAPDPSARATPPPVPVVAKDRIGLDPTLELTTELSQQMLEKKPLPYADTLVMGAEQIEAVRRAARPRPVTYLASLGRELAQAWRQRAWVWVEVRIALYRLVGKTPPQTLVERARSYRESFNK